MSQSNRSKDFIKTTIGEFMYDQTDPLFESDNSNVVNTDGMKELLIQALDAAFETLGRRTPQTKKKTESVSIIDVSPVNMASFMLENNIPNDAYFGGSDNGYDAWDDILLCWDIDIPTTDKDKLDFCVRAFTTIAFTSVSETLTSNGYKRVGYSTSLLKPFDDTTVYAMYIAKDYDRLVKYYSLPFIKE